MFGDPLTLGLWRTRGGGRARRRRLREVAPARAAESVTALQRAFYVDGLSLSDPATCRKVAEESGLDADAVVAAALARDAMNM